MGGGQYYCTDPILTELWNSALDDLMSIVDLSSVVFVLFLFVDNS